MPAPIRTDPSALDFGAQGGDPSRGVDMDLSTCVNRYGPPPAAIAALRDMEPADIMLHPYDAGPQLVELYRDATGVAHGEMIAGRGASEFIWAMGRELDHASVQVPTPAYTDYLKVFPGRGFNPSGVQVPSLDQIDAALNAAGVVIISNPHNPTGAYLDADGLTSPTSTSRQTRPAGRSSAATRPTSSCCVRRRSSTESRQPAPGSHGVPNPRHWHAFSVSRRTGACPVWMCEWPVQPSAVSTGRTAAERRCMPTTPGWPKAFPV